MGMIDTFKSRIIDHADLVFIKVVDDIYTIKKNRYDDFFGQRYVSNEVVIKSLNSDDVAIFDESGELVLYNFCID